MLYIVSSIVPYLIFALLFSSVGFMFFRSVKHNIKKKKENKLCMSVAFVMAALLFSYCGYLSLDIFCGDPETYIGTYVECKKREYSYHLYFDIGEDELKSVYVSGKNHFDYETLEVGEIYEYVKAKRTKKLLSIKVVEKNYHGMVESTETYQNLSRDGL
ncbi:MAG: hypothetical protein IKJ59_00720 [Clostridia bacterium]|nr:hypothetical protein [Clostridia bacterium]